MSEIGSEIMEATGAMSDFLFKDRKEAAKVNVADGTWDKERGVYTKVDQETGVTTEYQVKKSMTVTSGLAVHERSYKTVTDKNGETKKVEVGFDSKRNEWVEKGPLMKLAEKAPTTRVLSSVKPKLMGTIIETRGDGGSTFTLQLEKARWKPPLKR